MTDFGAGLEGSSLVTSIKWMNIMHTVLYYDPNSSAWHVALTTADENMAVQLSCWLNEIGWSSRIERTQPTATPVVDVVALDTPIGPMASC
jgi:hypothetical protein